MRDVLGPEELRGVGVGAAGLTDRRSGTVLLASNLGWRDVPLRDLLSAALGGARVDVDKDTNVAALAEARLGAGRTLRHFLYVTVGTGIGGGEVLDGRLYRGATGGAGDIGHVVVDPAGPRCGCGASGCVEVYASGAGIVDRARERGLAAEDTEAVFRAAEQGDPAAADVVEAAADALGLALATYVNLNNPEAIIVGGGVAAAAPGYRERAERALKQRALPALAEVVDVLPTGLDGDAGALGGVLLLSEDTDERRADT